MLFLDRILRREHDLYTDAERSKSLLPSAVGHQRQHTCGGNVLLLITLLFIGERGDLSG